MRLQTIRLLLPVYLLTSVAGAALAQTGAIELTDETVQAPTPGKAGARCQISVSSEQSGNRRTFSATEVLDLDLRVRLASTVHGEHLLRVEVDTPKGHLYQALTVPFTTDRAPAKASGDRPQLRTVEGFPRPLPVQRTEPVLEEGKAQGDKASQSVVARLPVAGTSIVHSSLYGKWTAEAYLDGEVESCGSSRVFFIQQ